MQNQYQDGTHKLDIATGRTSGVTLLAEVNFKRLMSMQGWWVDSSRVDSDLSYASELIRFATSSQSFALRECATLLRPHVCRDVSAPRDLTRSR